MKITISICILLIVGSVSYWIGWGNGQASAYYKMDHAPSLYSSK